MSDSGMAVAIGRDAILREAVRLMAVQGYVGTNLGDVAASFGVTRQAMYYHFAKKHDILFAVFTGLFDRLATAAEEIEASVPPEGRFREMVRSHAQIIASDPLWARVAMDENKHLPPQLGQEVLTIRRRYFDRLVDAYEQAVQAGLLRDVPAAVATRLAVGPSNWLARWYRPDADVTVDQMVDLVDEVVFSGLEIRSAGQKGRKAS